MKKSSNSSKRWLREHFTDKYVKQAQQEGFRARSVYKLKEIVAETNIIKPNFVVVDLGAAPGSWSEYVVQLVGARGKVFAVDILPIKPIARVNFIQGDFTNSGVQARLLEQIGRCMVDVVLSDMAPNISGINEFDQMRSSNLVQMALAFALQVLKPGGVFLVKMFQGSEFAVILATIKKNFTEVKIIKPESSRARSKELFLLARGFMIN